MVLRNVGGLLEGLEDNTAKGSGFSSLQMHTSWHPIHVPLQDARKEPAEQTDTGSST